MDKQKNTPFAVGDHIRMKNRLSNEHQSYQTTSTSVAFVREAVDGLVFSAREIATGRLVPVTSGNPEQYIFEILIDNTFNPKFASTRNAPRTAEKATGTPSWRRMRATLHEMGKNGQLLATSSPDFHANNPLDKVLDGWKIIKVLAKDLSTLEQPDQARETE
jgi:hypothetical protein